MYLADHLSRSFLRETTEDSVPDLNINDILLNSHLPVSETMYKRLQNATYNDSVLQEIQNCVIDGWPQDKWNVSQQVRPYWSFRDEISCVDGILFKGEKIMIPNALRKDMLCTVHQSHLGIVKSKNQAREVMFWPGMSKQI